MLEAKYSKGFKFDFWWFLSTYETPIPNFLIILRSILLILRLNKNFKIDFNSV